MRSMHSRNAVGSPTSTSLTALRNNASASPARNTAAAMVVLLRQETQRPSGLPDRPFSNGRPRTRCVGCGASSSIIDISFVRRPRHSATDREYAPFNAFLSILLSQQKHLFARPVALRVFEGRPQHRAVPSNRSLPARMLIGIFQLTTHCDSTADRRLNNYMKNLSRIANYATFSAVFSHGDDLAHEQE
jgi:hypothetical protein